MNNNQSDVSSLLGAAGIGAVAGLRSMVAPALVSQAAHTGSIDLGGGPFAFLSKQRSADIATGAAVLELVADKLPFTPDRTTAVPLIVRAISGGVAGAAVSSARKQDWRKGACVGGVAALAASFAGFWIRRSLTRNAGAPDLLIALAEDALAVACGVVILRDQASRQAAAD
ncbi:MAG: DUF4126 family protein [Acidobacteriota bacterium]|nr:DUF4126 family protein [Acidobacteriota bacterium]